MSLQIHQSDKIYPLYECEIRRIDVLFCKNIHSNLSYGDILLKYKDYKWSKHTVTELRKIWQGTGYNPRDLAKQGFITDISNIITWSKEQIISMLSTRIDKALEIINTQKKQQKEDDLHRQGIYVGIKGTGFRYDINGYNLPLSFKNESIACSAKENINSYISRKIDNLNIFEMGAKVSGIHPAYISLIKSLLEQKRNEDELLVFE